MFYDGYKTLTHDCLFNFVVGSRGCGKTYWAKKWSINDFIKNGKQFMYVRRYKEELKKIGRFFADISQEYPDHSFSVKGRYLYIDGKEAGIGMPLSTSKIEKSVSFPNVNKIIFDEFIIDKGVYRYLNNEVEYFLELYETVARMREVTHNEIVRVFFLSNAITWTNPYFLYFNLQPRKKNIIKKDDILLEVIDNEEFKDIKKQTRFAKLIEGTEYSDYAIDNKFLRDDYTFIKKKTGNCYYYCGLIYKGTVFGVWYNSIDGVMYVSNDYDKSSPNLFAMTLQDHSKNTVLLKRYTTVPHLKQFVDMYKEGHVCFESINIKNVCYEIIKMCLT